MCVCVQAIQRCYVCQQQPFHNMAAATIQCGWNCLYTCCVHCFNACNWPIIILIGRGSYSACFSLLQSCDGETVSLFAFFAWIWRIVCIQISYYGIHSLHWYFFFHHVYLHPISIWMANGNKLNRIWWDFSLFALSLLGHCRSFRKNLRATRYNSCIMLRPNCQLPHSTILIIISTLQYYKYMLM